MTELSIDLKEHEVRMKEYKAKMKEYDKKEKELTKIHKEKLKQIDLGIPSHRDRFSDSQKFNLLVSDKKLKYIEHIEYSLIDNKLFEMDKITPKKKKIIDYIYSKLDEKKYLKEKNSVIYYNEKTQMVYDFAASEKSIFQTSEEELEKEIFCNPDFIFSITSSDRTREMLLKSIQLNRQNVDGVLVLILDLKSNVLMLFKRKMTWDSDGIFNDMFHLITPESGKFKLLDIEFDPKMLF